MAERAGYDPFAPVSAAGPRSRSELARPEPEAGPSSPSGVSSANTSDDLDGMLKTELIDLAAQMGLSTSGNKPDLIGRIRAARG